MYERIITRLVRAQWLMLAIGLFLLGMLAALDIYLEFNLLNGSEKAKFVALPNAVYRTLLLRPTNSNSELYFWLKNSLTQIVAFFIFSFSSVSILFFFQRRERKIRDFAASSSRALRSSERLFRSLYDSAAISTALMEASGKLTQANDALCKLMGYNEHELCKGSFEKLSHPDDFKIDQIQLDCLWRNHIDSFQIEKRFVHESGSVIWALVTYSSLKDEFGNCQLIVVQLQNITDYKSMQENLHAQANNDFLTQLPNRRHFIERASLELSRVLRYGNQLAVLMIDIDHFKKINDQYGHFLGDQVLKKFSQQCATQLRKTDFICRFGGEEFAVLMPETNISQATEIAERLRINAQQMRVEFSSEKFITFTISLGIAIATSDDKSIETVLVRADTALYQAKHTGRNKVALSTHKGSDTQKAG